MNDAQKEEEMEELRRRVADLEQEVRSLSAVIAAVAGPHTLEEVLETIVGETARLMGTERVVLFIYDEEQGVLEPRAQVGHDWETYRQTRLRPGEGTSGHVFATCEPHIVRSKDDPVSLNMGPENRQIFERAVPGGRMGGGVAVPLFLNDRPIGTLSVSTSRRSVGERDLELLQRLGEQAVLGIERARRTQALEERNRELEEKNRLLTAFQQIGQVTLSSLELEQVLDNLVQQIVEAGLLRTLMIALVDARTRTVEVVRNFVSVEVEDRWVPMPAKPSTVGMRYALDDANITAEVARTGRMQVVDEWDRRFDARVDEPRRRRGRVAYFVPVKREEEVLAVLATGSILREKDEILHRIEVMEPLLNAVAIALEHARLYRELRESEERIRQAQKMEAVGQLTAGIAHHFNNMLQGILGNVQLALMDAEDPLKAELQEAENSAQRAADIVRQLMLFARRTPSRHEPVDLERVLREIMAICQRTFDRRTEVELRLEPGLPGVMGDAGQLEQVFLNLCLNARDALEQVQRERPYIRFVAGAEPDGFVRISVEDNGEGMEAETQERAFEPFFTTREVGTGTGLGLATAYAIVEEHGGYIECASAPGEGTTFVVHLPAASAPVADGIESGGQKGGRAPMVLLIDDEEIVRRSVSRRLERAGYRVVEAVDGVEGLEVFARGGVDLVLLDLSMPRLSGQQVLESLRAQNAQVPVVLFTGYAVEDAEYEGADAVLQKPVAFKYLLDTVRRLLDA